MRQPVWPTPGAQPWQRARAQATSLRNVELRVAIGCTVELAAFEVKIHVVRAAISKAALASISPNEVLGPLFSGEHFGALSLALATVDDYLAEAVLLQRRMTRARREIATAVQKGSAMPSGSKLRRFPFRAVHFYANCWTIVGLHLRVLRDISGFARVGRALRPHIKLFDRYTRIRDHYEHLNERLPGQKNVGRLRARYDYGNLLGTTLTIGGERTDVGPDSLRLLRAVVRDVVDSFRLAALERLATDHPATFVRLLHNVQLQKQIRRIQKEWH